MLLKNKIINSFKIMLLKDKIMLLKNTPVG
jgi:hypothetical protein